MANYTVTSTADSGSGSLRQAIADAVSGDTIVFDSSLEVDGVITIYLGSQLLNNKNDVTIYGGETWTESGELKTRVVLDAQADDTTDNQRRVMQLSGTNQTISGVTFINGYVVGTTYGGGLFLGGSNVTRTINNCVLKNCSASLGGGVYISGRGATTFNNCQFLNCESRSNLGGGIIANITSTNNYTVNINNCYFINCSSDTSGGAVASVGPCLLTINNSVFMGNTANRQGAGFYFSGAGTIVINNCDFGTTTSTTNICNDSTTGTLDFQGTTNVDKFTIREGSAVTISGVLNADVLTIGNGASVTFADEAELVVTNSATIGTATFSAATGDSATATFPAGTSLTNATWTNVATTLVVNSTSDDGTGTLRNALTNAVSGTTITFDDALEEGGVITILLSSQLSLPATDLTIDGGETWTDNGELKTRVVIDGQGVTGIFYTYTVSYCNVAGVTFKNGNSAAGGAIRSRANGVTNSYTFCVFDSCSGSNNGGALYLASNSTNNIINCVFKNCTSPLGASIWISGSVDNGSSLNINNCVFYDTSSSYNIYISTTVCPLVINGSLSVDKIYIINGATVTFSGVDAVLAVTTTATIGAATFAAAADSNGFLAVPVNTNISSATFTGVVACNYGAGITAFRYRYPNVIYTATNISIPALLQKSDSGSQPWTSVALISESPYNYNQSTPTNFRLFDGATFLYYAFPGIGKHFETTAKFPIGYLVTKNTIGYLN